MSLKEFAFAIQEIHRLLSESGIEELLKQDATTTIQVLYTMQEDSFRRLQENLEQAFSLISTVLHDENQSKIYGGFLNHLREIAVIYGSFLNHLREIAVTRERLRRAWKDYSV